MVECPSCRQETRIERAFTVQNHKGIGRERYDYLHCERCDVLFVSPFPSDDELDRIYARHWQYAPPHQIPVWAAVQSKLHALLCNRRLGFAAHVRSRPGQLLDVGCGRGEFLKGMKKMGWDAWGNDTTKEAVEQARENTGGNHVYHGDLMDCKFPSSYFDMATLWYVLEHVRQPSDLLLEVRRVLKPDGVLIIEVPNVGSLALKLFEGNSVTVSWHTPEHLFYWSERALRNLLKDSGFQLIRTAYPMINPHPLDFARSFGNFLGRRWGVVIGGAGFLISVPFSIFNNFVGNFLFGSGEVVRFIARKVKS